MATITLGEDITPYHSDPMKEKLVIMHTEGDSYANDTACGEKLIKLHQDLQRLDFPYYFVEILTTNGDIERELVALQKLYSTEETHIKYLVLDGRFKKKSYKGDTHCVLPFIQKYVNPQGLVLPCCLADDNYPIGSIKNNDLDQISTKPIREQMLKGQRPTACNICWVNEDAGLESHRQRMNKSLAKYQNQKDFVLRHLDIRLSNKCNLMCRMCSGKFSNRIAQEEEKLYGFTKYKDEVLPPELVEKQLKYIEDNVHTIERAYFAGGEPLINEEHYRILQILIDNNNTDIRVSYNTNFSMLRFKKYNVLDYWKHFKEIEISASLDAHGHLSEYVRYGAKYEVYEKNYEQIKNIPNITFKIHSTLHMMNITNLPILQKHWLDKGLDCSNIELNVLTFPIEQSIAVLPKAHKTVAIKQIDKHCSFLQTVKNSSKLINQWISAKNFMLKQDDSYLLGKFFKINNDKDKNRKQKFEDYLPEYNNLRNFA